MSTNVIAQLPGVATCSTGHNYAHCIAKQQSPASTRSSFTDHLHVPVVTASAAATVEVTLGNTLRHELDRYSMGFQKVSALERRLLVHAKGTLKPLIEAQVISSRLNLQTQILTRAADTFAATLKRLQQLGSGS